MSNTMQDTTRALAVAALLPCPFCGEPSGKTRRVSGFWHVFCDNCGARASAFAIKETAIEAWNERAVAGGQAAQYQPVPDGEILNSNGLYIEADVSGGWLLRFGRNGASIWFPGSVRLCTLMPAPVVQGVGVPVDVRVTLEYVLNCALEDYASGRIVEEPPIIRERIIATMAWLRDAPAPQTAKEVGDEG